MAPSSTGAGATTRASAWWTLGIAVFVVVLLPQVPFASLLARPLVWLSTLMHEGGHGVASLFVGGGFEKLEIFPDASGYMHPARGVDAPWKEAVISLGGLVGPAAVSALFLGFGVVPAFSRLALIASGALALLACVTVASGFAVVVAGLWGVCFVVCGVALAGNKARIALLVLAVELAGSVFSRGDYLFTSVAKTAVGESPSDVAQIARVLGGHYLVWGTGIALLSVVLLGGGLVAFSPPTACWIKPTPGRPFDNPKEKRPGRRGRRSCQAQIGF